MDHRLNLKTKTMKSEENTGQGPCNFGIGKDFLGWTQRLKLINGTSSKLKPDVFQKKLLGK